MLDFLLLLPKILAEGAGLGDLGLFAEQLGNIGLGLLDRIGVVLPAKIELYSYLLCVIQYSTDWQYIKKFHTIKEAASEIGISETSIRHACNGTAGRKTAGGFIWRYDIE